MHNSLLAVGATCASLGYAEYVPANYASQNGFPLVIALHGDGQSGYGTASDILKLDDDGLPAAIAAGTWDPQKRFVVLAPQMNYLTRTADEVRNFIAFAKANYKIDPGRIYLTAYSGGGGPFYRYMETYDGAGIAAAAPISTVYTFTNDPTETCSYKTVPLWVFPRWR